MKRESFLNHVALALSSGFFISYLPAHYTRLAPYATGAGLLGTLEGALLFWLFPQDPAWVAGIILAVLIISILVSAKAEEILGTHDDPRIVIDEIIGMWITLAFLPRTFVIMALGFVLFRTLDVTKPWLIRRAAKLPGGWGIVGDDVLAGVIGNIVIQFYVYLSNL